VDTGIQEEYTASSFTSVLKMEAPASSEMLITTAWYHNPEALAKIFTAVRTSILWLIKIIVLQSIINVTLHCKMRSIHHVLVKI
jgi:hypothetical protein